MHDHLTLHRITKKIAEDVDKVIRPEWVSNLLKNVALVHRSLYQKTQYPDGYRNLASLGKAKEKSSRSATPSQPAADKEKKAKDEAKENGSKLKNGTTANGDSNGNEASKKEDVKGDSKADTPEVIVV